MRRRALPMAATACVLVLVTGCGAQTPPAPEPTTSAPAPDPTTPPRTAAVPVPPAGTGPPGTGAPVAPGVTASAPAMPTGAGGRPRGLPTVVVDPTNPDSVAMAFATTTFAYDTAHDVSEFDAQVRAADYATPAYAAQLRTPLARTGSAVFTTLAAHQGFTTVTARKNSDDGAPPDGLRAAARSYGLVVTGHGTAGWTAPVDASTIYVFLTRTGGSAPWQVDRVTFGVGT